jgi:hypothetical protein
MDVVAEGLRPEDRDRHFGFHWGRQPAQLVARVRILFCPARGVLTRDTVTRPCLPRDCALLTRDTSRDAPKSKV